MAKAFCKIIICFSTDKIFPNYFFESPPTSSFQVRALKNGRQTGAAIHFLNDIQNPKIMPPKNFIRFFHFINKGLQKLSLPLWSKSAIREIFP